MRFRTTWKMVCCALVLGAQGVLAASSAVTPTVSPGDRCHRCGRLITNPRLATAVLGNHDKTRAFRTVGCLLAYLNDHPVTSTRSFVTDDETGTLVEASNARFVPIVVDVFTGEPGYGTGPVDYLAFKSRKTAERFALAGGASSMTWQAVLRYAAFRLGPP